MSSDKLVDVNDIGVITGVCGVNLDLRRNLQWSDLYQDQWVEFMNIDCEYFYGAQIFLKNDHRLAVTVGHQCFCIERREFDKFRFKEAK